MLKLLQLRLMFLACWLLLPASAYADAVRISFGENANAFSLTLIGSAVQSDFTYDVSQGKLWRVTFTVTEDPTLGAPDRLTVTGRAQHAVALHAGEGDAFFFPINLPINGLVVQTFSLSVDGKASPPHGAHVDQYLAQLTIQGGNGQINRYIFHVEGRHCTPQCPELPVEIETPEPTTVLLFGTGLVGVAIKMRKKLKTRKRG